MSHNGEAIGFTEIQAWLSISHANLSLWECESVKALSESFVTALTTLSNESDPPPWLTEEGEKKRAELNAALARAMIMNSADGRDHKAKGGL